MGYKRVSLRVDEWPPTDQRNWALANSAGDALEPGGRAALWKPKTRIQVAKDVGRFLFWLASESRLLDGEKLSMRVDAELKGYLAHLMRTGMASTSLLSRLRNLRQAVRAMEPDADIRRISLLCARLKQRAEPVQDKAARVVSTARLADAALREYDRLVKNDILTPRTCHRARDALMLLFLAYIPLRLENFTGLAIGQHIVRNHHGYLLRIDRVDQKDGRDYDAAVPDELVIYLDHYINRVLPRLLKGRTSDRLWISTRGTGMSASTVYYQICRVTRRLIGHSINPHAFRDCVMTSIASDAPDKVQAGARLLGHRNLRTGERHYNFATSLAAQRQYHEVLRSLRERNAMSNTRGK